MVEQDIVAVIDKRIAALQRAREVLIAEGGSVEPEEQQARGRKRPQVSAAVRARIAQAQRQRWEKVRKEKEERERAANAATRKRSPRKSASTKAAANPGFRLTSYNPPNTSPQLTITENTEN